MSMDAQAIIRFQGVESERVSSYAVKVLTALKVRSSPGGLKAPGWEDQRDKFEPSAIQEIARVVGAYHAFRHTPRALRGKKWPKDLDAFAESIGVEVEKVREAVYQSRYHRWEQRYLPKINKDVRVAMIKDSLLDNVLRQGEAEPGKENANLYRTALQSEGEIQGTQKVTQVNIGSNVVNMPEGLTAEMLQQRLETVNRLAQRFSPREVPHVDVGREAGQEEPQATRGRTLPSAPTQAQGGSGGTGEA